MKKTQIIKIVIDCAMLILLPLLMTASLLGQAVHEWLGVAMVALFVLHHVFNRKWFGALRKGKYTPARILTTAVDFLLLLDMLMLFLGGILMSRHVFAFLHISFGAAPARTMHLLGSYWGLVLMPFHVGLHGGALLGIFRKAARVKSKSKTRTWVLRIIAVLLCALGIWAFARRDIWTYLTLQNQFVFFDFSEPVIAVLADYAAIMCLFGIIGHYVSKCLRKFSKDS